jgi:hypothetical protein
MDSGQQRSACSDSSPRYRATTSIITITTLCMPQTWPIQSFGFSIAGSGSIPLRLNNMRWLLERLSTMSGIPGSIIRFWSIWKPHCHWYVFLGKLIKNIDNDQSLLENYHCFLTFQILSKSEFNILENYGADKAQQFRKILIHIVLDTDLAKHFLIVKALQSSLYQGIFDVKNDTDRMRL